MAFGGRPTSLILLVVLFELLLPMILASAFANRTFVHAVQGSLVPAVTYALLAVLAGASGWLIARIGFFW